MDGEKKKKKLVPCVILFAEMASHATLTQIPMQGSCFIFYFNLSMARSFRSFDIRSSTCVLSLVLLVPLFLWCRSTPGAWGAHWWSVNIIQKVTWAPKVCGYRYKIYIYIPDVPPTSRCQGLFNHLFQNHVLVCHSSGCTMVMSAAIAPLPFF